MTVIKSCDSHVGTDSGSSSSQHLHTLHLQHNIQGAASNKKGEATSNNTPNPAKMPTTWKKRKRNMIFFKNAFEEQVMVNESILCLFCLFYFHIEKQDW